MNTPHEKSQPSVGDLTAAGAFLVGVFVAWLYAVGWTYAYHYFDHFGVPLLMVDIPKESYFMYGWLGGRHFPVSSLVFLAVALAAVCLRRFLASRLGGLIAPLSLIL